MKPLLLAPNQPDRFYAGGAAIAKLRGLPGTGDRVPEDWIGSTVTLFGQPEAGLTTLPDGRSLRAAILADPEAYLGPEHVAVWGANPALLVKLLDAGERLPVHCHPDRDFARRHLDCPYGKTEAWIVVEAEVRAPLVYLGFDRQVTADQVGEWVRSQDASAMLGAMNALPVEPGDAVLVPAGLPHAIGEGVFVVELQEPTDFSVLLEWEGFDIDGREQGHLGLGFDIALGAVDRSSWDAQRLADLRTRMRPDRSDVCRRRLPSEADVFFRAEHLRPRDTASLAAGYSILVVLGGHGALRTERGGDLELSRGATVLLPYAAGAARVSGEVDVVRCRPPAPDTAG